MILRTLCLGLAVVVLTSNLEAQRFPVTSTPRDSIERADIAPLLRNQLERSSFFLPFVALGNAPKVWFEGNIVPNILLHSGPNAALFVTPKVVLRMVRGENSVPVRTPSYMPRLQYFHRLNPSVRGRQEFLFGTFAHYSNGQPDSPLLDSLGRLSSEGNFSTFYGEVGVLLVHSGSALTSSEMIGLRSLIKPMTSEPLWGLYSPYRYFFSGSLTKGKITTVGEGSIQFGPSAGYMKRWYHRVTYVGEILGSPLSTKLQFRELVPFIQYRFGEDYYNVSFKNYRSMLRLGVTTRRDPLSSLGDMEQR
jgi:hypothetical protein